MDTEQERRGDTPRPSILLSLISLRERTAKPALILDLDHTLITGDCKQRFVARPGVELFLRTAAACYTLAMYTLAEMDHAAAALELLDPTHEFFGDRVMARASPAHTSKAISDFGFDAQHTLVMDDRPEVWAEGDDARSMLVAMPFFRVDKPDIFLIYAGDILLRLHNRMLARRMSARDALHHQRKALFRQCRFVFCDGGDAIVTPLRSTLSALAVLCGAEMHEKVVPDKTTCVIAAKCQCEEVEQAHKLGIDTVHYAWLMHSLAFMTKQRLDHYRL